MDKLIGDADQISGYGFSSTYLGNKATGGGCGLFGKKEIEAEPFAQTLSNELKKVGFLQPSVAGYHGKGLSISAEDHHYRRLPKSQESDVRASTVRKRFMPV